MARFPRDPMEEIEEVRDLLLGRERQELRELRDQLTRKERRSDDVAAILPEAVKLSRSRGDQLSLALRPVIERSIRESVKKKPETLADILSPILGSIVRRSITQRFRRFFKSSSRVFDQIYSWEAVKWRFEALRTGKSFAEVRMRRSLVYRVEEVFLIHRETGLSLLHVAADPDVAKESGTTSTMLRAIHDFARDSFEVTDGSSVVEFRFRQMQIWIALEHYAYLAAIIRGNPSGEVRSVLKETIESIHVLKGSELANFTTDLATFTAFESLRPELESCLLSEYGRTTSRGRTANAWIIATAAAAAAVFGIIHIGMSELQWRNFVARLNAQPGVVVTDARKGWFTPSYVSGLRDPSAADPLTIAREEKLDPSTIHFQWKAFLALDPTSIMERFKRRFNIPSSVRAIVSDGVLSLSGSAPYDWLERVRREATFVPGITSLSDHDVEVIYDPGIVLKRFQDAFDLPATVYPVLTKRTLTLSGEAPHRWLTRVRSEATKIPGIVAVDEHNVVDLDQRTFQQAKSVLESAFVRFVENSDEIATDGFAILSRLPDQLNRLANGAKQIGVTAKLEVLGYASTAGAEPNNAGLGQRRANKVRDFFVSCGYDAGGFMPIGIETLQKPAVGKSGPEQTDGYVTFKVVSEGPTRSQ
jgi:outer membrane protein OmpA-like peptidoglycan-associated protein